MGIQACYEERLQSGNLKPDPAQAAVVGQLERLTRVLEGYGPNRNGGLLARLRKNGNATPKGLYIWGDVGRGKTMFMDMFFAAAPVDSKRRVHFHAFMQDIHGRLNRVRKAPSEDAIRVVAREVAAGARLLCLDEMQINDIADAMIVGRLFEQLLALGTIIVTTSNLAPDGLYKDGLNRNLFLPFISLIEKNLEVVELASPIDYRLGRVKGQRTFVTPLSPAADAQVQYLWEKLTDTDRGKPQAIEVLGRTLVVPQAAHGAARFTFADLCEAPLGPADYLALARTFGLVFIENIPVLLSVHRNFVKRFILLIDTLYDCRVRLVASSELPPAQIYSGSDYQFEFARTASRLEEMQSASWWGAKIAET